LGEYFTATDGFDAITSINTLDGIRIYFANGDIAHLRPSGNAPQMRIYSVANSQLRANEIVELGLKENGILSLLAEKFSSL
jgi:phosphomannomutase